MPETAPFESLCHELGAEPPAAFADLPGETQQRLADLLREARHHNITSLNEAVASGLSFVPRPLRGAITKLVMR